MGFFDKLMSGVGTFNELAAKRIDKMSNEELNKIGAKHGKTANDYRRLATKAHQNTEKRKNK